MRKLLITIDFLRFDHAGALRNSGYFYDQHYTFSSFTIPVLEGIIGEMKEPPVLISDGKLLQKITIERFTLVDDWRDALAKGVASQAPVTMVHLWKLAHQTLWKNPGYLERYQGFMTEMIEGALAAVKDYDGHAVITADHGIVLDVPKETPFTPRGPLRGRRWLCEGTLHVPLWSNRPMETKGKTSHKSLARYLSHDPDAMKEDFKTIRIWHRIFKDGNFDGNTITYDTPPTVGRRASDPDAQ